MRKISRKANFKLFKQAFCGEKLDVICGLNPCTIKFNGNTIDVYIKILTPAQLSNNNPDVWRCQLPKRHEFNEIKESPNLFLLLGYDVVNDVFATWNPYWVKQRLNIGESVSMYSRLSVQKQAHQNQDFVEFELNHNGKVIVFPRFLLPQYINSINGFFPEKTDYVAIGSSLRKVTMQAEELFSYFSNPHRIKEFGEYLKGTEMIPSTQKSYVRYMNRIFEEDFFNKYKSIFLKYDSIQDYEKAIVEFCHTTEIAHIDRRDKGGWHGALRAALNYYYKALTNTNSKIETVCEDKNEEDDKPNILQPDLAEKLVPIMCQEEPQLLTALQVVNEYFGDTYNESMQLQDWINLLKSVDWKEYRNDIVEVKPSNNAIENNKAYLGDFENYEEYKEYLDRFDEYIKRYGGKLIFKRNLCYSDFCNGRVVPIKYHSMVIDALGMKPVLGVGEKIDLIYNGLPYEVNLIMPKMRGREGKVMQLLWPNSDLGEDMIATLPKTFNYISLLPGKQKKHPNMFFHLYSTNVERLFIVHVTYE